MSAEAYLEAWLRVAAAEAAGGAPLIATVAWGEGAAGVARAGDDAVQVLHLVSGASRPPAAALHVHPNSLDYRLRRIGELTGRQPSTPRGLQVLAAALTLRGVTSGVSTRYS